MIRPFKTHSNQGKSRKIHQNPIKSLNVQRKKHMLFSKFIKASKSSRISSRSFKSFQIKQTPLNLAKLVKIIYSFLSKIQTKHSSIKPIIFEKINYNPFTSLKVHSTPFKSPRIDEDPIKSFKTCQVQSNLSKCNQIKSKPMKID